MNGPFFALTPEPLSQYWERGVVSSPELEVRHLEKSLRYSYGSQVMSESNG